MKAGVIFLLGVLVCQIAPAQTITSFDGMSASQLANQDLDVDPSGAVGTKQFMEWVNVYLQAYDKTTFAPVWSTPQPGIMPWQTNNMSNCYNVGGDGVVLFDHLAKRWVVGAHTTGNQVYYYCLAISSTDDLTSPSLQWYTYEFHLNPLLGMNAEGNPYFPDWPKLGTWSNGYYVAFDLLDVNQDWIEIGTLVCAFDRANMLNNAAQRSPQCFTSPSPVPTDATYFAGHSLIPADIEGLVAPPASQDEFMLSIQDPPQDGVSTMSTSLNLWDFHVDWETPSNTSFTRSSVTVPAYEPGCYVPTNVVNAACAPEPSINPATGATYKLWTGGDRLLPSFAYRNFGTYGSFVMSHVIQGNTLTGDDGIRQTGIRWYEFRGNGSPALHQSGTVMPTSNLFLFMPSMGQDHMANAAIGYNISSPTQHPSINAAWWNLAQGTVPTRHRIFTGSADAENSNDWGSYVSMTTDPVDDCTFWYVNEYFSTDQTKFPLTWRTRIANFAFPACTAQRRDLK